MSDIVERLRRFIMPSNNIRLEAADEITRLRADLAAANTRMSKLDFERTAAELERDALAARLAPVDDEALVEIVGKALRAEVFDPDVLKVYGDLWAYDEQRKILKQSRAAIAAIRPHIEAAERERCARIAEGFSSNRDWVPGSLWGNIRNEIAAAIRRGGK